MRRLTCLQAFTLTLALAASLPEISRAASLDSPTGTVGIVMIDKVGSRVRFFDPAAEHELASLVPGTDPELKPHQLVISPDHRTAYVSIYGDGVYGRNRHPGHTVAIIDLTSHQLVGNIELSPYEAPHGIQIDAAGMLYVACDASRKVLVIDPSHRHIEAAIDVEGTGHRIALLPDASKLYVSNKNDRPFVSVVDVRSRKMVGRIAMPNGTEGIVASPDGKTVLAADLTEPYVHVFSTATDIEVDRIQVQDAAGGVYTLFFDPTGRRLLALLASGQINIFDPADLHAPQRIVHSGGTALMGIGFAADGRTALVGNHAEGTVSSIDLQTAMLLKTFRAGRGIEALAYY
jgi:DNA-binding beta-propeller fold protein YncE